MLDHAIPRESVGFSLLELLVVILIVGLLAGLSIPPYRDHVIRAQLLDVLATAQSSKLAVTEALIKGTPPAQINHIGLGLEDLTNMGATQSIVISNGTITITVDPAKLRLPADEPLQVTLTPDNGNTLIRWRCVATPDRFQKYLPSTCNS